MSSSALRATGPLNEQAVEINVSRSAVESIVQRVRAYDWHEMPQIAQDADRWAYGCDRAYLQAFCAHWTDRYDWSSAQAALNAVPQFTTVVDGLDIHFLRVRGSGHDGTALLLTHGWPGSVFEFYGVIDRLAHPQRYGGAAADGVDVVRAIAAGIRILRQAAGPVRAETDRLDVGPPDARGASLRSVHRAGR